MALSARYRHFLQYLADKDLIPASLTHALDRFVIPRIIIIDEFPEVKKRICINCSDQTAGEIPTAEYYSIAKELRDTYLDRHNYYKTMKNVFCKAWRELYIFLEANGLSYSYETASRMLKNRTNTDTIADSLGHSDTSTVLKYLATDGDTMRQCALSLKGIEVNGRILCIFRPHPDTDSGNIRTAFRNYPDSITAYPDTLSSD